MILGPPICSAQQENFLGIVNEMAGKWVWGSRRDQPVVKKKEEEEEAWEGVKVLVRGTREAGGVAAALDAVLTHPDDQRVQSRGGRVLALFLKDGDSHAAVLGQDCGTLPLAVGGLWG